MTLGVHVARAEHQVTGSRHQPGHNNRNHPQRKRKLPGLVECNAAVAEMGCEIVGQCVSLLQSRLLLQKMDSQF